jgi:ABC-type uncharacterized transport system substrate-binding protein
MNRRTFLCGLTLGPISAPLLGRAQELGVIPRIGVLFLGPRNDRLSAYVRAHEEGLQELGWIRNRTLSIEERFSGTMERMPAAVAELISLKVKAIVTGPNNFIDVARQGNSTVPIVMVYAADPVGRGYVASLARPGGNITGLAWDPTPEIGGKYVELLTEVLPRPLRIAGIVDPEYSDAPYRRAADVAAKSRGITLHYVEVGAAHDFPKAFDAITRQHASAIIIFLGPFLYLSQPQISDLARKKGLATVSMYREGVDAGVLMSYGPNLRESWRRAAFYVDKILRGAKPADLPVEQPTKFELVINLKTAKALGITIPQSLLVRADELIQ